MRPVESLPRKDIEALKGFLDRGFTTFDAAKELGRGGGSRVVYRYARALRAGLSVNRLLEGGPPPKYFDGRCSKRVSPFAGELPEAPEPEIAGILVEENYDEDAVYAEALEAAEHSRAKAKRRGEQSISFARGPVCLVFMADQHFGNAGTDYRRAFGEAELVRDTPGMYAVTVGDLLDQFLIGRLRQARDNAPFEQRKEWALVRRYIRVLSTKLVAAVSGNHDGWSVMLSNIDYFRDVLRDLAPNVLYDSDDCTFTLRVGDSEKLVRIRHKWSGSSIWNPTHGQERAARFDHGPDLLVGAHTHTCGVARGFNNAGHSGLAIQVGTYKSLHDDYASREGFIRANQSTAIAVICTEDGELVGFESLKLAAEFMRAVYHAPTSQTVTAKRGAL